MRWSYMFVLSIIIVFFVQTTTTRAQRQRAWPGMIALSTSVAIAGWRALRRNDDD